MDANVENFIFYKAEIKMLIKRESSGLCTTSGHKLNKVFSSKYAATPPFESRKMYL